MTVSWNYPTRIVFGNGALAQLADEAKKLRGSSALIVADKGVTAAGLSEQVRAALEKGGVAASVFDGIGENPTDAHAIAAIEAYHAAKADIVIALGGGSPLDAGKIVRIGANHPLPLDQYDAFKGGTEKLTQPLPPMIAIPTTAGTGSEVGRSAVLTLKATQRKTIFFAPQLMPNVALLDPVLTVGLPPKTTAATGFDALTHCVEAYCTPGDHPMADAIALAGIERIAAHLPTAVRDGKNLQARGAMLQAATFGAVAFQKGLGACHSLAHPLSAELGMHHGLANALCLPAVLAFNASVVPERLAKIARLLGAPDRSDAAAAAACRERVVALRSEIGLPSGLGAVGVTEAQLEKLSQLAFEDPSHTENPRPCKREDLLAMYRSSL
jgi:alcohol dehydrogenase class IV